MFINISAVIAYMTCTTPRTKRHLQDPSNAAAITMVTSYVEERLVESCPHPHIPAITGPPKYETIANVTGLPNADAASTDSKRGGGNYGHLALNISTAAYNNLYPDAFIEPINPDTTPVIASLTTLAAIGSTIREHDINLHIWREYNNVNAA
jgi:hypothetical protein